MGIKIIDDKFNRCIKDLNAGDLFAVERDGDEYSLFRGIFMKIDNIRDNDERNAVKLTTGELYKINDNMMLQRIQAELKLI